MKMLTVCDSGCCLHQERHLTMMDEEAEVMEGVLRNLPQTEGCAFYVCEHGHSHSISFTRFNQARLSDSANRHSIRGL